MVWPWRRKLPSTATVAPSSRNAEAGSEILSRRTSLVGTTHSDCLPASRLVRRLAKLSISPAETCSFAGSLPTFSKGSTATCSSGRLNHPATRSRTGGRNETTATKTAATATKISHRCHFGEGAAAVLQTGREACSICWRRSEAAEVTRPEERVDALLVVRLELRLEGRLVMGDGGVAGSR